MENENGAAHSLVGAQINPNDITIGTKLKRFLKNEFYYCPYGSNFIF
jgi:hypothetical protein